MSLYLGRLRPFIHYPWLVIGRSYRPHVYLGCIQHLSNVLMRFLIKGVALAVPSSLSLTMLFLVFIYYLVQGASESIDANPIPSLDKLSLESNHCTDLTHCRAVYNIIWSCLITIFSCTWVAIHPNIPCLKRREANSWVERYIRNPLLSFAEHRLPLFICALLVPEYVLAWAIRQFLSAREIAKENRRG